MLPGRPRWLRHGGMEKANVNGMPMEYAVKGSGEPVLLISTGPIADSFLPLFPEKALAGYRLIRYRQRGLDRSNGRTPVSFETHAADAAGLLAARSEEHTSELQSLAYLVC